jgi:hypothetical protein
MSPTRSHGGTQCGRCEVSEDKVEYEWEPAGPYIRETIAKAIADGDAYVSSINTFHDSEEVALLKEILSQIFQLRALLEHGKQKINIEYR